MYKCKYFSIKELLPKELHNEPEWILLGLFDDRILRAIDLIREKYGPVIVNSQNRGLDNSGFRLKAIGARYSQHLFGRAIDCHILSIENQNLEKEEKIKKYNEIREELIQIEYFKNFRFEWNVGWLHIDRGNFENKKFVG